MKTLEEAVREEIARLKQGSELLPELKDEYINQGFGVFALWMNLSGFSDDGEETREIAEMRDFCTIW